MLHELFVFALKEALIMNFVFISPNFPDNYWLFTDV